jgi:hypothetical protein
MTMSYGDEMAVRLEAVRFDVADACRGAVRGTNWSCRETVGTSMTATVTDLRARDCPDRGSDRPPEGGCAGSNPAGGTPSELQ